MIIRTLLTVSLFLAHITLNTTGMTHLKDMYNKSRTM